jgi:DNA-binding response OmpR family regulator
MNKKTRVLVVDDEMSYIRAVEINLEARGYQVLTAQDGQTAIDLVASEAPDLVLLDLRMPGMDGFEVCRRIRDFTMVPIIMLTALAEDTDKVRGLDTGAENQSPRSKLAISESISCASACSSTIRRFI